MVYLLFIGLPMIGALYTLLLSRHRSLVLWTGGVALILGGYLIARLPLERPVRLLGALLALAPVDRLFAAIFLLLVGIVMVAAHVLHQGELPIPIGLFILSVTWAMLLLDDPLAVALLLQVVGLTVLLATVDRPHEPVGLLPASALMAGLKYLIMTALSGFCIVPGLLLLNRFLEGQQPTDVRLALGLLVVGLGLGTAVVPFHLWFPDLAGHTSTAVTALLVAPVQGMGLILLVRILLRFPELLQSNAAGQLWLAGGSVGAAVAAALLAAGQDRLKRLAAYASSFDLAFILYALAGDRSLPAGLFLTVHHGTALVLLLVCIGTLEWSTGRDDTAGLVGIGHRLPMVAGGMLVAALSLAGIPPWGGFPGRWPLYQEALVQGWPYLAGLLLAAALFLLALVRSFWPLFLPAEQTVPFRRAPWPITALILLLMLGLLFLGLYPQPLLGVLETAVGR
ncbi:MAG: proton-conducting transporter membrane subunit [Chloroflexia bacterium]